MPCFVEAECSQYFPSLPPATQGWLFLTRAQDHRGDAAAGFVWTKGTPMPGRASAQATSESSPQGLEDQRPGCSFGLPASLPDVCTALCHELSERLTATGNYLGALQRLLEIGYRPGQPLPEEILEKARSEVARAGEVIHQFRRTLTAHQKS